MTARRSRLALLICAAAALPAAAGLATSTAAPVAAAPTPIYLNTAYSPQERAADLVSRLTLAEKSAQMDSSRAPAIPRLGIAAWGWWNEAGHGVAREQTNDGANPPTLVNTTSYPVDLSLGSTWNPALVRNETSMISDEAREIVQNNTQDLDFYSPTINLSRDPRWGRNDETFSEDPTLTAALASQWVDGLQGQSGNGRLPASADGYTKAIATVKHFAANNSEYNRRTGSSDMDERTLREYYTAQFRDVIAQAHPGSIMSSYNSVNQTPAAANLHLIDTLARQTFGFDGYFTSDCDAVYEIQAGHHWQPPNASAPLDQYGRTAYAVSAGEDLDCDQGYHDQYNYGNTIPTAIGTHTQTGVFTENDVDASLVRLFTARIKTGEFDDQAQVPWVQAARARLAPGTWVNSDANGAVTETPQRLQMARRVADQGIVLLKDDGGALPMSVPAHGAYKVAVIGQYANPATMFLGGYSSIQGPAGVANEVNGYQGIKAAVQARNPSATVDFLPGTSSDLSTLDQASVRAAKNYDAVIVYAGTDASTSSEDHDRSTLALPGAQAQLIRQVAARNPNTVAYLETVGAVDVRPFANRVKALLWSSYNGQRKGQALADVLLGSVDPSGHLPFTWYRSADQLAPIGDYAIRGSNGVPGRTYEYFRGTPSFPFGYGLSYTSFRTSHVTVSDARPSADSTVRVGARLTNTGSRAGSQVVQLYATTPDARPAAQRPVKRLESFRKVHLAPGASTTVTFTLPISRLAFFDENVNRYVVDPGRYGLQVGSSSTDIAGQQIVTVHGKLHATPAVVTARPVETGDEAAGISQRVFFPSGVTVDPQLTVSLSDESLYGYNPEHASRRLPKAMTVSYHSDRPSVVRVDPDGRVHTVGTGVATVTATVSYHGGSRRGSFVVDVTS